MFLSLSVSLELSSLCVSYLELEVDAICLLVALYRLDTRKGSLRTNGIVVEIEDRVACQFHNAVLNVKREMK